MILKYKEYPLSNDLSMFFYYKKLSGRTLEKDASLVEKQNKIQNDPKASAEDKEKSFDMVSAVEVYQFIYASMRCAAEKRTLDFEEILSEIDINDLVSGELYKILTQLLSSKKKHLQFLKIKK